MLLVVGSTESGGPATLLLSPFRRLAPTSYGVFLFHLPVMWLVSWLLLEGSLAPPWHDLAGDWIKPRKAPKVVALVLTFVLGWLSRRFFESWFVDRSRKMIRYEDVK